MRKTEPDIVKLIRLVCLRSLGNTQDEAAWCAGINSRRVSGYEEYFRQLPDIDCWRLLDDAQVTNVLADMDESEIPEGIDLQSVSVDKVLRYYSKDRRPSDWKKLVRERQLAEADARSRVIPLSSSHGHDLKKIIKRLKESLQPIRSEQLFDYDLYRLLQKYRSLDDEESTYFYYPGMGIKLHKKHYGSGTRLAVELEVEDDPLFKGLLEHLRSESEYFTGLPTWRKHMGSLLRRSMRMADRVKLELSQKHWRLPFETTPEGDVVNLQLPVFICRALLGDPENPVLETEIVTESGGILRIVPVKQPAITLAEGDALLIERCHMAVPDVLEKYRNSRSWKNLAEAIAYSSRMAKPMRESLSEILERGEIRGRCSSCPVGIPW